MSVALSGTARAAGVAVLVVTLAGCWWQPGYGPLRQGSNPIEDELTQANVASLQKAWTATVDDGPVRGEPVASTPGLLHVGDDRAAYGIRPVDGTRAWRAEVVPPDLPAGATTRGLTSDGTTVHVAWGGVPDNGTIAELDAATGAEAGPGTGPTGTIGHVEPIVRDGTLVAAYSGHVEVTLAITGLLVSRPDRDWPESGWNVMATIQVSPLLPPPTSPAITSDRFYAGVQDFLPDYWGIPGGRPILGGWDLEPCGYVDPCTPNVWVPLDGAPTTPVVSNDEATVFVATDAGTVYAVDAASGAVRWTAALGSPITHRPALTPDALYVVTGAGRLVTLDPAGCGGPTCEPVASTRLRGAPAAAPAVAGGVVYAASAGGKIEAFAAEPAAERAGDQAAQPAADQLGRHERLWSTSVRSEVTGGPIVTGGRLIVGTDDGRLVAFQPDP
jgi:outer membrane protein assembly factor BamB